MKISATQLENALSSDDDMLRLAIRNLVAEEHAYVVSGLPQDLFDAMIDEGLARARAEGLTRSSDLACFVMLMFDFGPEFYLHPKIRFTLRNASVTPEMRLQQVTRGTTNEVWREITDTLATQSWFPGLNQPIG